MKIKQYIILLASLPQKYEHFVDTLMYGRETLSMNEVLVAINSKELARKFDVNEEASDGLFVRVRSEYKSSNNKAKSQSRSKSKFKQKCLYLQL